MGLKKSQSFEIDGDDGETLLTLSNDPGGIKITAGDKSTVVSEDDWRNLTRAIFPIKRQPKDASSSAPAGGDAGTATTGRRGSRK